MHNVYMAYGLTIASELELPELLTSTSTSTSDADAAELEISYGQISTADLDAGTQISPFVWVSDDTFWLHVPGVARFSVSGGSRIVVMPFPGVDQASVRVFLLGSVLGAVLFQRGLLLLHGNAVEVNGRCLVCLGPSGVGKSTLATAFMQRGYRVLADDVVPIDGNCSAVPGFPRLKVWEDTVEKMAIGLEGRTRVRPQLNKFNLSIRDSFCDTPLPVRWIYLLSAENRQGFEVQPISGMNRFVPLRNNTYRRRFMEGMALRPEHLKRCGELAGRVHFAKVIRPKTGFDIDGLVDTVLADIEGAG